MIELMDDHLYEWATWSLRDHENLGYPSESTLERIKRIRYNYDKIQGSSAPQTTFYYEREIPMPASVERTERALVRMPLELFTIVRVKYLFRGWNNKQRAKHLHMTTYKLHRMVHRAHIWLEAYR